MTRAGRIAYTASKFGLVGATKTAAVDLAEEGILVNAVSPGFTMTELTRRTVSPEDVGLIRGASTVDEAVALIRADGEASGAG